jgi:hypothetical protein
MTITSLDTFIAAPKQKITYTKIGSRTTVANGWFSLQELAGQPGAGSLAGSNTANGLVPDDNTVGYPAIGDYGSGSTGMLGLVEFSNIVPGRLALFDRLFLAGAYAFNAATTLASQPSFATRVPNTDYKGLELWAEQVTAATGNQAVSVNYTNQVGTTGKTTGATGIGSAQTVGRCWQLPLAAGDSGIQKIESVTGSTATAGTFNIMVLRPLWQARVQIANGGDIHDLLRTGAPVVPATAALYVMFCPDGTSTGTPDMNIVIANG